MTSLRKSLNKKKLLLFTKAYSIVSPNLMAKLAVDRFCSPRRYERSAEENLCFQKGKQVDFASGRIANIWGENGEENQPLILLIHGWESRGTAFYAIIEALVKQNYKVLAWNAPAHGASPGTKTQIFAMALALVEDLKEKQLAPHAMLGHSMGGAMLGLLNKYMNLPKCLVIISAPTFVRGVFSKTFKKYGMSDKAVAKSFELINAKGEYSVDEVSLVNSDLYKDKAVLVIHDENDKEVPFEEFTNLKNVWKEAVFYPTIGLGHRRIIRDEKLAKHIALYIRDNI